MATGGINDQMTGSASGRRFGIQSVQSSVDEVNFESGNRSRFLALKVVDLADGV